MSGRNNVEMEMEELYVTLSVNDTPAKRISWRFLFARIEKLNSTIRGENENGIITASVIYIERISNHSESVNRLAFVLSTRRFYSINKSSPDAIIASLNSYA